MDVSLPISRWRPALAALVFAFALLALGLGFTSGRLSCLHALPAFEGDPTLLGQSGWQPGAFSPSELPESLRCLDRRGSWVGGDGFTGEHRSGWFRPGGHTAIAVAGYPTLPDNRLEVEVRRSGGGILTLPFADEDPRERWLLWQPVLPADAEAIRLHAVDGTTTPRGWLAFSQPLNAAPTRTFDLRTTAQTFSAVALALVLVLGPGLVWRCARRSSLLAVLWPGPLGLALGGGVCWLLGALVAPASLARVWVGITVAAVGWLFFRRRVWAAWTRFEAQLLALLLVCVLGAAARAAYSGGPRGELYAGSISRTLEVGGRSDSRISYHTVQLIAHHLSPYEPEGEKYFSPWQFSARGPLAGIITAPLVFATGGQPPLTMPDQPWQPFDRQGFAAFRIGMMTLSALALLVVAGLLLRLGGENAARLGVALVALTPFFWHELYFSWPKLTAATCVLVAFGALLDRRPPLSALWIGIGYLCHPLALLSAPFLGVWILSERERPLRSRLLRVVVFAAGILLLVFAWQAVNGFRPGQSGFLTYARAADSAYEVPASVWWLSRWHSFANTVIPFYQFLGPPDPFFAASGVTALGPIRFFTQYWTSAPFAAGLLTALVLLPASATSLRRHWRIATVALIAPALLLTLYWGATVSGLVREGGHVIFLSSWIFLVWSSGARLPGWIFGATFAAVRVIEVLAMMFIPAFAAEVASPAWLLSDLWWLSISALCVAIAAGLSVAIARPARLAA